MLRPPLLCWVLPALLLVAGNATAEDVVWLKNGDRLTGKILSATAIDLTLETGGGNVKIPFANVKTLASDRPLHFTLEDGSVLEGRARAADTGGLIVATPQGDVAVADPGRLKGLSDPAATPEAPKVWTGKAYGAATISGGNARQRTAHADAEIVGRWEKTRLTMQGAWDYAESEEDLTVRKAYAQAKYDWLALDPFYAYTRARIEGDTFQDLAYRLTLGVGAGWQVIKQDDLGLDLELGASWVCEDLKNGGEDDAFASADGAARFFWKILPDVLFREELLAFKSLKETDDVRGISTTSLDVALSNALAVTAKVIFEYDNTPAPGAKRRDVRYMLGITYNFW
ncbi:MAG: DUF481 domain-containing protein [Planctomycetes bacterium]|nr:DUF481 domain-containing protein [Planctomycetota bacterium]